MDNILGIIKVPWSEKWSGQHYSSILWRYQLPWGGIQFINCVVQQEKVVRYSFYGTSTRMQATDPAHLVQKTYCNKSSAWPRVELRFCPWLPVPIMCIARDGQEMRWSFLVIYSSLPSMSWKWYTKKNETAQRERPKVRLRSKDIRFILYSYVKRRQKSSELQYKLSADCVLTSLDSS